MKENGTRVPYTELHLTKLIHIDIMQRVYLELEPPDESVLINSCAGDSGKSTKGTVMEACQETIYSSKSLPLMLLVAVSSGRRNILSLYFD